LVATAGVEGSWKGSGCGGAEERRPGRPGLPRGFSAGLGGTAWVFAATFTGLAAMAFTFAALTATGFAGFLIFFNLGFFAGFALAGAAFCFLGRDFFAKARVEDFGAFKAARFFPLDG